MCSEMICAIYKFMLLVCTCRKDVVLRGTKVGTGTKTIGKLSVVELQKEKYESNVSIREKKLEMKKKELELE